MTSSSRVFFNFQSYRFPSVTLFYLLILLGLSACSGNKQSLIYETFKLGISNPNTIIDEATLNPNFQYLKVDANGQPALLVLGYGKDGKTASGDVWYSAYKEVIEIKDGRLGSSAGLAVNWTDVKFNDVPPLIEALNQAGDTKSRRTPKLRFIRTRTVMPGYYVNIRETVILEALNEAPSNIPKQLRGPNSSNEVRWVQETVLVPPNSQNPSIKPLQAVYAIDTKTSRVVYGRQYLTPDYYVAWLSWPYPNKKEESSSK